MKVGDHIRLSEQAVRVYALSSDNGLIVGRLPNDADNYPDDYYVLIDGKLKHMGFAIEQSCEVVSKSYRRRSYEMGS